MILSEIYRLAVFYNNEESQLHLLRRLFYSGTQSRLVKHPAAIIPLIQEETLRMKQLKLEKPLALRNDRRNVEGILPVQSRTFCHGAKAEKTDEGLTATP